MKSADSVKQQLTSIGIEPGFVLSTLPNALRDLAAVRSKTKSAHGGIEMPEATQTDAQRACDLVGRILRGIVRSSKNTAK